MGVNVIDLNVMHYEESPLSLFTCSQKVVRAPIVLTYPVLSTFSVDVYGSPKIIHCALPGMCLAKRDDESSRLRYLTRFCDCIITRTSRFSHDKVLESICSNEVGYW